jgi:hypothetical protein
MQVTTPRHRNECINLEDKLKRACAGFRRHSSGDGVPGIVMIHVAPDADVERLAAWIRQYLNEGMKALDVVFLYQPNVRRSAISGNTTRYIYLHEIESPTCRIAGDDRRTTFFVGTLLAEPFQPWAGPDDFAGEYRYQSGNLFVDASIRESWRLTFGRYKITTPLAVITPFEGLHIHKVVKGTNGEERVESPQLSPDDRLLIL